jgi:6-phosphogluconolactonase
MNTQPQTVLYLAEASAGEIVAFAFDPVDGSLAPFARTPAGAGITPLALRPDRRVLYAGLRAEQSTLAAFGIDAATGRLEPLASVPLADPPMYLATDAGGAFALSASYAAGTITINALRSDGGIEPTPADYRSTPPRAHAFITDPTNRFAFVCALGSDEILQFHFDSATGRVTPNAVAAVRLRAGCGPRHIVVDPSGTGVYVNGELDGSMTSFALDSTTGRLSPLARASMLADGTAGEPWAAEIAIRPDGRFIYASERRTSTVAIFAVDRATGGLERRAIVATEEQPRSIAVAPDGRFLLVAGERSGRLTVYAIDDETSELRPIGRIAAGAKPVWMIFAELS